MCSATHVVLGKANEVLFQITKLRCNPWIPPAKQAPYLMTELQTHPQCRRYAITGSNVQLIVATVCWYQLHQPPCLAAQGTTITDASSCSLALAYIPKPPHSSSLLTCRLLP